jgi:hypothetical protein
LDLKDHIGSVTLDGFENFRDYTFSTGAVADNSSNVKTLIFGVVYWPIEAIEQIQEFLKICLSLNLLMSITADKPYPSLNFHPTSKESLLVFAGSWLRLNVVSL